MLVTMTDHLGADICLVPCQNSIMASQFTTLFFDHWYCKNGLPKEIVSDCDKLFMSRFWKSLHKLTRVKVKMLSAYHPQTDGTSEHTNKTVNQCLHFHVQRNQKGWVRALPRVCFHIMNSVNASTGFLPFQLHIGCSPCCRGCGPYECVSVVSTQGRPGLAELGRVGKEGACRGVGESRKLEVQLEIMH